MYHNFFIHSSVNGHLGCLHVPAIINSAATKMMHIYGIQKAGTGEFICRVAMEKQRIDLWTWSRGRRERVRCMERVTWKFTIPYVKQIANGNLLYDSGNLDRGSVTIQRGGMGRKMGRRFRREGTWVCLYLILFMYNRKPQNSVKAIILQLK